VTAFVDTSVVVRYLIGDPPHLLEAARRIVDSTLALTLTDVVIAETAFVLTFGGDRECGSSTVADLGW
jgi:predicted nucleic acid-binding protein